MLGNPVSSIDGVREGLYDGIDEGITDILTIINFIFFDCKLNELVGGFSNESVVTVVKAHNTAKTDTTTIILIISLANNRKN